MGQGDSDHTLNDSIRLTGQLRKEYGYKRTSAAEEITEYIKNLKFCNKKEDDVYTESSFFIYGEDGFKKFIAERIIPDPCVNENPGILLTKRDSRLAIYLELLYINYNLSKNNKNILTYNIVKIYNTIKSKSKNDKGDIIMRENRIVLFTKYLLNFMFCTGILVAASLPYTLKLAGKYYSRELEEHYISMLLIFFLSGICGLVIVYQLRKMIGTVIGRNCFSHVNTKSLRIMETAAFVITVLFLIKLFLLPAPATFIIVLIFFIAGLFSHVLGLVFSAAIRYKEENDLTI